MSRKKILLFGGAGVLVLIAAGAVVFGGMLFTTLGLTRTADVVGEDFMAALRDGNYRQAYSLCAPALQTDLGSVDKLGESVKDLHPTQWTFTSRQVEGGSAQLDGDLTYGDQQAGKLRLVLDQIGNDWRVSGFKLGPP